MTAFPLGSGITKREPVSSFSNAPISQAGPIGRFLPVWSTPVNISGPQNIMFALSIAGLCSASEWVGVSPPLSANGFKIFSIGVSCDPSSVAVQSP